MSIKWRGWRTPASSGGDVDLDGPAGTERCLEYKTAGLLRWAICTDDTSESGSNAGSNLTITSYKDDGTVLQEIIEINRATGVVDVKDDVQINGNFLRFADGGGDTGFINLPTPNGTAGLAVECTTNDLRLISGSGNVDISATVKVTINKNTEVTGQVGSILPSTLTPSGTTQTIDWDDGNAAVLDLGSASGNVTLTLSNPVSGFSYQLKIIQGATARQVILPSSVKLANGNTAPHTIVPNTTDNSSSVLTLTYYGDGSSYMASFNAGEFK